MSRMERKNEGFIAKIGRLARAISVTQRISQNQDREMYCLIMTNA